MKTTKKKTIARYVYIRGFVIFTALCCVVCYIFFFFIHVCIHAAFHSVLKYNTIQYLLLSITVVAVLATNNTEQNKKVTWINYVLIDRLNVF